MRGGGEMEGVGWGSHDIFGTVDFHVKAELRALLSQQFVDGVGLELSLIHI